MREYGKRRELTTDTHTQALTPPAHTTILPFSKIGFWAAATTSATTLR